MREAAPAPADYRLERLGAAALGSLTPLFVDAYGHGELSRERLERKYAYGAAGIEA